VRWHGFENMGGQLIGRHQSGKPQGKKVGGGRRRHSKLCWLNIHKCWSTGTPLNKPAGGPRGEGSPAGGFFPSNNRYQLKLQRGTSPDRTGAKGQNSNQPQQKKNQLQFVSASAGPPASIVSHAGFAEAQTGGAAAEESLGPQGAGKSGTSRIGMRKRLAGAAAVGSGRFVFGGRRLRGDDGPIARKPRGLGQPGQLDAAKRLARYFCDNGGSADRAS